MSSGSISAPLNARAGLLLICAGIASLSVSDAIAKELTSGYPVLEILFLRCLIALPFVVAVTWRIAGRPALFSRQPLAHLGRSAVWVLAATCFFTSLRYLGLAEATTLVFIAPVFITALSAVVFKEHVGWRRWTAVFAGFIGVLIVVRPGAGTFQTASILPIVTAFLYAVFMLSARWVDKNESAWTLMLYQVITGGMITALAMPFVWVPPVVDDLHLFLGIAAFGTVGVTLITQAFRVAPASTIAPFEYTALLWATFFGWLFWNELPDAATYIGAAVIVGSGVFIVLREAKAKEKAQTT